jgi:hypothetical protein
MEIVSDYKSMTVLTPQEMEKVEGGMPILAPLLVSLAAAAIVNIQDIVKGAIDGWNAFHH